MPPVVIYAAILFSTCVAGVMPSCSSYGPGSCSFNYEHTCYWTPTAGWYLYSRNGYNWYLGLSPDHNVTERMESRTACSTNGAVHCFKFRYYFEDSDNLDLSVILKTETGEKEVWRLSSSETSDSWASARVPVNTSTEFNVIFEASSPDDDRVFIDTITYERKKCSLHPQAATPPPIPETTSTTTTSSSTKTTVKTTFTTSMESSTTDHQEQKMTSSESGAATTTLPQNGEPSPVGSTSDAGIIAGAVVAAVVILVVVVVLCLLIRRKQFHRWKTCFRQREKKETEFRMNSAHNAAYSQDVDSPDQFINVNTGRPEPDTRQHNHYETPPSHPPADSYYSVINSPTEATGFVPPTEEFSQANKPKTFNHGNNHESLADSLYEINDAGVAIITPSAPPDEGYNQLSFRTVDHGDHSGMLTSSTKQTGDYDHLAEAGTPTHRDQGLELYQNTMNNPRSGDQGLAEALYQNVPKAGDTQKHRHMPDPADTTDEPTDLTREDQSGGLYHLPGDRKASNPEPYPSPVVPGLPDSNKEDITNSVYHVLQDQTPSEFYPESRHTTSDPKTEQYQHLDFERKEPAEERGEDVPVQMYSHLNEGAYDEMERGSKKKVIDEHYSHI